MKMICQLSRYTIYFNNKWTSRPVRYVQPRRTYLETVYSKLEHTVSLLVYFYFQMFFGNNVAYTLRDRERERERFFYRITPTTLIDDLWFDRQTNAAGLLCVPPVTNTSAHHRHALSLQLNECPGLNENAVHTEEMFLIYKHVTQGVSKRQF
jgi:hypothetical protein